MQLRHVSVGKDKQIKVEKGWRIASIKMGVTGDNLHVLLQWEDATEWKRGSRQPSGLTYFVGLTIRDQSPTIPVIALLLAAERVLGRCPKRRVFPGGTDASKLQAQAGISTISSFGPSWLNLAHSPNGCVGVKSIVQAAKMYALAARIYLIA